MSGKLIARKGDKHNCPLHGEGTIITGFDNYLVEGQPVARVGDLIQCPDGSTTEIVDNDCCMEVGGKKVARLGDKTTHGGEITSSASTTFAEDQNTFIRFGGKGIVKIGKNVRFGGVSAAKATQADNNNAHSADSASPSKTSTSAQESTAVQSEKNMFPSAEVKLTGMKYELPVIPMKYYILSGSSTLDASLKVDNKNSVNPATFDKEGFKIEAHTEAAKVFATFRIKDPHTILDSTPMLAIYNDNSEYKIELTPTLISENEKQFVGVVSKETSLEDGEWRITGEITINLTINCLKSILKVLQ
jgi:uncharacterized Zn-binding protein involved in type VI secretion